MTRHVPALLAAAAVLALADPAAAQVALELRGGASVGNYTPAAAGLETLPGPGYTVAAEFGFRPGAAAYAAFGESSFRCREGFCQGQTVAFASSGFGAGIRLHRGIPWIRAGLLYHAVSTRSEDRQDRSGSGPGFELGGGVSVPVASRVRVQPGVAYRRHSVPGRGSGASLVVLSAELGLRLSF